jgi:hypothetical protein
VPVLDLFVDPFPVAGLSSSGNLDLAVPLPSLNRVLLQRLYCSLRAPPVPGAYKCVLDTGAPLSIFPYDMWHDWFGWRAGREFDELTIAGVSAPLTAQILGHQFPSKLARLRVPVELCGRNLAGDRLRLDSLVCLLAESGGPAFIILGLWGGAFTGRRLTVESKPNSDDLQARLDF